MNFQHSIHNIFISSQFWIGMEIATIIYSYPKILQIRLT